jgi:hypothetical protein
VRLIKLGLHLTLESELHALACAQALPTSDDPGALLWRRQYCTVEVPAVFLVYAGYPHDTPAFLLTGHVTQQHRPKLVDIAPIRFGPPLAAIDRNTGRVDHEVLDALGHQGAVPPDAIAASLVTAHALGLVGEAKALLRSCDLLL